MGMEFFEASPKEQREPKQKQQVGEQRNRSGQRQGIPLPISALPCSRHSIEYGGRCVLTWVNVSDSMSPFHWDAQRTLRPHARAI